MQINKSNCSASIPVSGKDYLKLELEEMFGSKNRWYACEKHGFPLNADAIVLHYIENGGAEDFARRYHVEENKWRRVFWHTMHPTFMLKRCFRVSVKQIEDKTGIPTRKALRLCRIFG